MMEILNFCLISPEIFRHLIRRFYIYVGLLPFKFDSDRSQILNYRVSLALHRYKYKEKDFIYTLTYIQACKIILYDFVQ